MPHKIKDFNLPEELHSAIEKKSGLILVSGLKRTGKTAILIQLAREFYQNRNFEHGYPKSIFINNSEDQNHPLEEFFYFPEYHLEHNSKKRHDFYTMSLRMAPELIADDREIQNLDDAIDRYYASSTGHAVYASINASSATDALEKYQDFLLQARVGNSSKSNHERDCVIAVVHMERDEKSGTPVISEIITF